MARIRIRIGEVLDVSWTRVSRSMSRRLTRLRSGVLVDDLSS